jgi:hypothetical protein
MILKARSYISFILILCFSVFLGHSLIPHHHHAEQGPTPLFTDCPLDHDDNHHHSDEADADHQEQAPPQHCHAFNDLVFQKYNAQQLPKVSRDCLSLFVSQTVLETQALAKDSSSPFIRIKIPDKLLSCKGALALRAPPLLA